MPERTASVPWDFEKVQQRFRCEAKHRKNNLVTVSELETGEKNIFSKHKHA
jgi:hypothetical protein